MHTVGRAWADPPWSPGSPKKKFSSINFFRKFRLCLCGCDTLENNLGYHNFFFFFNLYMVNSITN